MNSQLKKEEFQLSAVHKHKIRKRMKHHLVILLEHQEIRCHQIEVVLKEVEELQDLLQRDFLQCHLLSLLLILKQLNPALQKSYLLNKKMMLQTMILLVS